MANARQLADLSAACVKAHDREGWLALFADDAIVEDPVGPSDWDPGANGHRGRDAIARFYDRAIAPNLDSDFEVHRDILCGDELARIVTMRITLPDGSRIAVPAVNCYRSDQSGKLAALRAFWDEAQVSVEPADRAMGK